MSDSIQTCVKQMINDLYDELTATVCSCMAAGVPASALIVTEPQLKIDGFNASMVCHIGFNWELIL